MEQEIIYLKLISYPTGWRKYWKNPLKDLKKIRIGFKTWIYEENWLNENETDSLDNPDMNGMIHIENNKYYLNFIKSQFKIITKKEYNE